MEGLETIMLKSPKLRAIKITESNKNKIVYTLKEMYLIDENYSTKFGSLIYLGKTLSKVTVGEYLVAHKDKSISFITEDEFKNNYLKYQP